MAIRAIMTIDLLFNNNELTIKVKWQ